MTTFRQMFLILLICAALIDTVFTCDAPTGSDILHQGSCSFTSGSTCGYRLGGHWRVHNGKFSYFFSDKIKDGHNSGDADHHYALLDTSQVNIRTPDILSSPLIMPGRYCLSFWYQISGPYHHFNVTLHTAPRPILVWELSDQTKGRWIQVTVNIKNSTPFKIEFQSQIEGFQTVAVDDILLGKQAITTATPTTTTPMTRSTYTTTTTVKPTTTTTTTKPRTTTTTRKHTSHSTTTTKPTTSTTKRQHTSHSTTTTKPTTKTTTAKPRTTTTTRKHTSHSTTTTKPTTSTTKRQHTSHSTTTTKPTTSTAKRQHTSHSTTTTKPTTSTAKRQHTSHSTTTTKPTTKTTTAKPTTMTTTATQTTMTTTVKLTTMTSTVKPTIKTATAKLTTMTTTAKPTTKTTTAKPTTKTTTAKPTTKTTTAKPTTKTTTATQTTTSTTSMPTTTPTTATSTITTKTSKPKSHTMTTAKPTITSTTARKTTSHSTSTAANTTTTRTTRNPTTLLTTRTDSMVLPMCASVSVTSTGNLLYLKNNDYPLYIRATETNCTCSVETTSCSSYINVYFLHFELDDGGGSCTDSQKIIINDNGTDSVFTCSDNTYYSITKMLTSSSNYLTVSLENTAGVNAGLVFTEYEATETTATLQINCPAKEETYCKGSTTGPSTKSTTISTTTNTNTKTITPYRTTQLPTIITKSPTSPITKTLTSSKHLTTTPKPTTTEQNLTTATASSTIPRPRTPTTTRSTSSKSNTKHPLTTTPITLPMTKTKTQKATLTTTTKTTTIPTTYFKTTSDNPVHFHLLPQQAIHTACESDSWNITINMRIMTSIYPDIQKNDIYLGNYGCKGTMESDMILVFHQGLQNCSTVETKTPHSMKFVNKLVYAQHDPVLTFINRRHFWDLNVECDVPRDATAIAHMHHDGLHLLDSINTPPPEHSSIALVFYRDQTYSQSLTGPPFHISVGETVYGRVFMKTQDSDIKLVLRSCYMKPYKDIPEEQSYYIIKNGCVTDQNTHIISYSQHEVRFLFQEIEYANNKEGLDIYCKASLCDTNDYTSRCDQSCHGPVIIG